MSSTIEHMGYIGTCEWSKLDHVYHGKVQLQHDLVSYEGETTPLLIVAFRAAVDDYLRTCEEVDKLPEVHGEVTEYSQHIIAESILRSLEASGYLTWEKDPSPIRKLEMVNNMVAAVKTAFSDELNRIASESKTLMEIFAEEAKLAPKRKPAAKQILKRKKK